MLWFLGTWTGWLGILNGTSCEDWFELVVGSSLLLPAGGRSSVWSMITLRHSLSMLADFLLAVGGHGQQESNGSVTNSHKLIEIEPNYRLHDDPDVGRKFACVCMWMPKRSFLSTRVEIKDDVLK